MYETALGPLETDEAFLDAFEGSLNIFEYSLEAQLVSYVLFYSRFLTVFLGISTGGVSLSHFAAAFLPASLYSPTSVEYYPPASADRQCQATFCRHLHSVDVVNQFLLPKELPTNGATSFFDFRLKSSDALLFTYEVDSRGLALHEQLGWERAVAQYVRQMRERNVSKTLQKFQGSGGNGHQVHLPGELRRSHQRIQDLQITKMPTTQHYLYSDVEKEQGFWFPSSILEDTSGGIWLEILNHKALYSDSTKSSGDDPVALYLLSVATSVARVTVSCVKAAHAAEAAVRGQTLVASIAQKVRHQAAIVKDAGNVLSARLVSSIGFCFGANDAHNLGLLDAYLAIGGAESNIFTLEGRSLTSDEFSLLPLQASKGEDRSLSESGSNAKLEAGTPATLDVPWDPWVHNLALELDESFSLVSSEAHLLVLTLPLLLLFFVVAMRLSGGWAFNALVGQSKLLILLGVVGLAVFSVASGLVVCHVFLRKPVTPLLLLVLHLMLGLAVHQALHTMRSLGDVKYNAQLQGKRTQGEPTQSLREVPVHSNQKKVQVVEEIWPATGRCSSRSSSQSSYTSSTSSVSVKRMCASEGTNNSFDWSWVETVEQQQFILEDAVTKCISCSLTTGVACVCALSITSTFDLPAVESYCTAAACCVACLHMFHVLFFCPLVTIVLLPELMPVIHCEPTDSGEPRHELRGPRHKKKRYLHLASSQVTQEHQRIPAPCTEHFTNVDNGDELQSPGVEVAHVTEKEVPGPCLRVAEGSFNDNCQSFLDPKHKSEGVKVVAEDQTALGTSGTCVGLPEPAEVSVFVPPRTYDSRPHLAEFPNNVDELFRGSTFDARRMQTASAVDAAAMVAAASGRNAERTAKSVQLRMDADKQERICELQSAGVAVSQQLRSHLHAMRTSAFGRFLAHRSYR